MKKYISIVFTLFLVFSIHAQSADVITEILDSEEVTFGQVCYISAVEQGLVSDRAGYKEAVDALVKNEQIPGTVDENAAAPIVDIAFIMSQIWDIKGGLMYRITKGSPRYSFKQFKSDGIIEPYIEPADLISGAKLLGIYTSCSKVYGGFDINSVEMESE